MSPLARLLTWTALLSLVAGGGMTQEADPALVKQIRSLPECTRIDGTAMDWKDVDGRALLIYFHRGGMDYSNRGLREAIDLLAADPALAAATGLVVVGFQEDGLATAAKEADVPGLETRVILDEGHRAFAAFRAVAFPTAYVLDAERRQIHRVRGFGPHFGFQLRAALQRASGTIDEEEFRARLAGADEQELTDGERRLVRVCGLARAMATRGEASAGLALIEEALKAAPSLPVGGPLLGALELQVRLSLRIGDAEGAAAWLERMTTADADAKALTLLRCRLELAAGRIDAAEAELEGLRARLHPEIELLRGRILEARGEFAAAAALYRELLERQVFE